MYASVVQVVFLVDTVKRKQHAFLFRVPFAIPSNHHTHLSSEAATINFSDGNCSISCNSVMETFTDAGGTNILFCDWRFQPRATFA